MASGTWPQYPLLAIKNSFVDRDPLFQVIFLDFILVLKMTT